MTAPGRPARAWGWASLAAALVVLDAAVTFENLWPTPAIWWAGGASVELAAVVLVMAVAARMGRHESWRSAAGWLAGAWVVLAAGRYAEVTAPALYGRPVNLYWDLRFVPAVVAMITTVTRWWIVALVALTALGLLVALHRLFRWAFGRVGQALDDPRQGRVLAAIAGAVIVLFVAQGAGAAIPGAFPPPVLQTYVHQASLLLTGFRGSRALPPSPPMDSTFANVEGADVLLVFIESYGEVGDTPAIATGLAPSRRQFELDVGQTGREAVSAYVESPTFGGSSWLAHLSLLTGIEVRDPDTNARLMTQHRATLVTAFARRGFRTIALMPGLQQPWPEGAFYGFDDIYGADRLAYAGPQFGWFALPDQFSLARLDALEAGDGTRRRFVFFPTISTHFPFSPTPPYQPDWSRMLTAKPYDGPAIVRAYARQPDWTNFAPGYVEAVAYDLAVLGGYLRRWADRDLVMILIGDHQPPALVSGEGASWNVPVHVILDGAKHPSLRDRLQAHGFGQGLKPAGAAIGHMNGLTPILLEAFGTS